MESKKLFGFLPVPIVYSRRLSRGHHAYCWWLFVAIHPEQADRQGLYEHELEHCRQIWRYTPLLYKILYKCSHEFRWKSELAAYRQQVKFTNENIQSAAVDLATRYNIDRTYSECLSALNDI